MNSQIDLTKTEKKIRHGIFRCLIALLRNEKYKADEANEFCYPSFDFPELTYSQYFSSLDLYDFFKLGVCPIPNSTQNALVCEKLARCFKDLSICGCFLKIGDIWRLDIDEYLSRRGLFLPVRSRQNGLIYGLKVFRYPNDQKPFLLKTRGVMDYE